MSGRTLDSSMWRSALLWKEFRQVAPLAITVLALGLGMLLLIASVYDVRDSGSQLTHSLPLVFLSIPMIYACGVGILLVGGEKESRSLDWLQSLPIDPRKIARSKLVVALLSLGALWLITLIAWLLFAILFGIDRNLLGSALWIDGRYSTGMMATYVAVSLYLCLAVLGLAWQFHSPLVSLLLLIPSSLVVWLVAHGLPFFTSGWSVQQDDVEGSVYLVCLSVGCMIALALGWVASQRQLAAKPAPRPRWGWLDMNSAIQKEMSYEEWILWPRVSAGAGMLWQTARQSWIWWIVFASMGVLLLWLGSHLRLFDFSVPDGSVASSRMRQITMIVLIWVWPLLIVWMGVYSYQGDGIQQRVRFYSDRCVSPSMLWWTRHWIPIMILLGLAQLRYWNFGIAIPGYGLGHIDTIICFFAALAIYITGQWVSQLIPSPILAAIAAPIAVQVIVLYGLWVAYFMIGPWGSLFIATFAILLLATWWMMKPWMERRFDWRYYLKHGSFAVVAFGIPLVPGLWSIWTIPSSPSATLAQLDQLAQSNPAQYLEPPNQALGFLAYEPSAEEMSIQAILERNEQVDQFHRRELLQNGGNAEFWLHKVDRTKVLQCWVAELTARRSQIVSTNVGTIGAEQTNLESPLSTALKEYRTLLSQVPKLVRELRNTRHLKICDLAERIELVALRECLQPAARNTIGESLYESLLTLLADNLDRDESRRIALANAWYHTHHPSQLPEWAIHARFEDINSIRLGGYHLDFIFAQDRPDTYQGHTPVSLRKLRQREIYVAKLWDLLQTEPGTAIAKATRRRAQPSQGYRPDVLTPDASDSVLFLDEWMLFPANTWRGDWETIPKELISKGQKHE